MMCSEGETQPEYSPEMLNFTFIYIYDGYKYGETPGVLPECLARSVLHNRQLDPAKIKNHALHQDRILCSRNFVPCAPFIDVYLGLKEATSFP